MVIECPFCETQVDAKEVGEYSFSSEQSVGPAITNLLSCPRCENPLVSYREVDTVTADNKLVWDNPVRVWPKIDKDIDYRIPDSIRQSLEEAQKCYKARAYNACAVMCGRALEGMCLEFKLSKKVLAGGLKELLDKGIIDKKIFSWGDELRKHRNIGAHATDQKNTKDDARDVLDFAIAICDYVFVLTFKFEEFMKRQAKTTNPLKG